MTATGTNQAAASPVYDLLIVGGGINGVGIARDAAGRGLSVLLVEKDDLAAHTSSASSKLIHGGLRYLEQLDFRLVRESLAERERLLGMAPHIIRPLRFVLPQSNSPRSAWLVRVGLLIYDHLGGRKLLPQTHTVRLDRDLVGQGLRPGKSKAFVYWDCRVHDSRLVVVNAMDAGDRGARIMTRTEFVSARREGRTWLANLRCTSGERTVRARALVNAAGPWVAELFDRTPEVSRRRAVRLIKGSHIVVPRLYTGDHAFLLQNPDGRIVFAIPFEDRFTLVGTTDCEWHGEPGRAEISEEETCYLLESVRRYFASHASREDVVWSYSGIRALCDDGSSDASTVTRDYAVELDAHDGQPPMMSIFGGKITTYRRLAEQALNRLSEFLPEAGPAWTAGAMLPGGEIAGADPDQYVALLRDRYPELAEDLLRRLTFTYGSRTERLLDDAKTADDLGEHFGGGLHAQEVDYLIAEEWARSAEDILFRRTKLGLHVPPDTAERLNGYISQHLATGSLAPGAIGDAA